MIRAVFDPSTQLLCTLLSPLADGASVDGAPARTGVLELPPE